MSDKSLIRLIYASHAPARAVADVPAILDWSQQTNPVLNVTGVLCLLDGTYMQYLEGEEATLTVLFSKIRTDSRHENVTLLEKRAIPKRAFPDWHMALLEWTDHTKNIFRSFSPGANLDLYAGDPGTAAPLVRALLRGPEWKLGNG